MTVPPTSWRCRATTALAKSCTTTVRVTCEHVFLWRGATERIELTSFSRVNWSPWEAALLR